jgi:hypothetical protein
MRGLSCWPGLAALLLLALVAAPCVLPPASAAEVQLSVRYSRPIPMYQGQNCSVTLYLRNLDSSRQINITWTGVHVDWLDADIYYVNETVVRAGPGTEVGIDVELEVPRSVRTGNHTESFNIEYDAYEGPGLPWGHYNWQSVPVSDFKVASTGQAGPPAKSSPTFLESLVNEPLCLAGGVVIVIIVIAGAAAAAARRSRRRAPPAESLLPAREEPAPAPAPPPAPAAPAGGPDKCPFCGAPNPGRHCNNCGWDLG